MSSSTAATATTTTTDTATSNASVNGNSNSSSRSAPYYYGELISGKKTDSSCTTAAVAVLSSTALVANNNSSSSGGSVNGNSNSSSSAANQTCSPPSASASALTAGGSLASTAVADNPQQSHQTQLHQLLQSLNLQQLDSSKQQQLDSPTSNSGEEEDPSSSAAAVPLSPTASLNSLINNNNSSKTTNGRPDFSAGAGHRLPPTAAPRTFNSKTATLDSSHYGILASHLNQRIQQQNPYSYHLGNSNTLGPQFANPLLSIEPDFGPSEQEHRREKGGRGGGGLSNGCSESLPRTFHQATRTTARNSNSNKSSKHNFFTLGKGNKQGIYQRSLSIFANGVSPLLRKKKQQQHSSTTTTSSSKNGSIFAAFSSSSSSTNEQHPHQRFNNYHNNRNPLSSNYSIRDPSLEQFGGSRREPQDPSSPTSGTTSPTSNLLQQHQLSASTLGLSSASRGLRRKSEPIMFSYDSITNELSKFTAREEQIVENINLDLEKMLMSDTAGVNGGGGSSSDYGSTSAGTSSAALMNHHHHQFSQQYNSHHPSHHPSHHHSTSSNSTAADASALRQQLKLAANMQQYYQQRAAKQQQSSSDDPYGRTGGAAVPTSQQQQGQPMANYKEPFYMVYEDSRVPMNTKNNHHQNYHPQHHGSQHHLISNNPASNTSTSITTTPHHISQHSSHSAGGQTSTTGLIHDDNIYEEIDFLTLSSLRAQYADTLSLQSYSKKKGGGGGGNNANTGHGSKRSLASSSFTRWFSTRKKNDPSPSMSEDESPYIVDIKIAKKQRPPITLPDPPPELTKEQLKRRYIIGSIVDSENSYIGSLQRIINCYKKPLEESHSPTVLSANKINVIFHRLEQILQCHTIFGIALSQCVREWDEKEQIGDVFIASFSKSMVLDIYSDFINNFTNAMETARKAAKSKSAFATFLQERSLSSPDRLSFFGLMVKPVQRFPQFILLLSDLLKHTPADHHDRMSLQLALTQLESLADRLNERKRDAERHFAVKQLLKDYLSSSTTSSSHRYLLRQDDILQLDLDTSSGLVMKTKCRKLYLLNDMLVCVSVPANRLKFAVSLGDVDVMDDVTPATNNLIANSMLKSKDSSVSTTGAGGGNSSALSSPKHCTVERMYLDLNSLIHDLEVVSRVANLLGSLRYQYNGLTLEVAEAIGAEIREEIRRKDAQISLIDRSCLQVRIRSKNYKDIIVIQLVDPEVKRDWLTDVRLAKLALDRANNPAWDIVNEGVHVVHNGGSLSTSRSNLSTTAVANHHHSIIMHRVPLFVKSLPIFATTEHSQLTCALHYRLNRRDDLLFGSGGGDSGLATGVLWICNVNENGSQLGALSTSASGADISLIHSYELCDSHVTCIESVGTYAVWIGLRQGRIIVIDASSPGEWQQFASLEVSAEVTCIRYWGSFVYVGLVSGEVTLFNATHYEEPIVVGLCPGAPVTCLLPVNGEMFACCGEKIWIINGASAALDRSYSLSGSCVKVGGAAGSPTTSNTAPSSSSNSNGGNTGGGGEEGAATAGSPQPATNTGGIKTANSFENPEIDLTSGGCYPPQRPNLLAHCGIGLWVSLQHSSIIKLYHTETFKHLQDVNVASNVKRILGENYPMDYSAGGAGGGGIFVTAMLATRGLLWIGTNVGVIVTLNLPRLQGVPLISGCLNVALHRHTGPVSILLSLSNHQNPNSSELQSGHLNHQGNSVNHNNSSLQQQQTSTSAGGAGGAGTSSSKDGKPGSASGELLLETSSAAALNAASQVVSELKSEDVESIYGLYSDLMNVENYVRSGGQVEAGVGGGGGNSGRTSSHHNNHLPQYGSHQGGGLTGRMTWELANMNLSDGDSTSESAIYGDGSAAHIRRKQQQQHLMRKIPGGEQTAAQNQQLSPAKSQSSIYDSTAASSIAGEKIQSGQPVEKNMESSSSGFGAGSSSLYDIAPFRGGGPGTAGGRMISPHGSGYPPQHQQRIYDSNSGGTRSAPEKTALLLTGGNGYKRITIGDTPYSSQHAHCCIWEYKL